MSDIVVIGAGVIGLTAARELRQRGADVLVLDRHAPGDGASSGNAGWIVPSYSTPVPAPGLIRTSARWMLRRDSPLYVRPRFNPAFLRWAGGFARSCRASTYAAGLAALGSLNASTMSLYDELRTDGVKFEMEEAGLLFAGLTSASIEKTALDLSFLESLGYPPIRLLDAAAIRQIEPAFSDAVAGGFHVSGERHVRPESLVHGLVEWLNERGVEVRANSPVLRLMPHGAGIRVRTAHGDIDARQVLVAAGVWSGELLGRSGINVPLEAGKGYSITWESPTLALRHPVDLIEAHVACTPFEGALRFAGTMEISGINSRIVPERVAALRRAGTTYFNVQPSGSSEKVWVGPRPMLPDGLPAIGPVRQFPNLFVATGHAMLGITLAPATAQVVAGMMFGESPSIDISPFAADRYNRRAGRSNTRTAGTVA